MFPLWTFVARSRMNSTVPYLSIGLRKIAKSDYQLRYLLVSVCPYGTTRIPLDEFSWNLIFGLFLHPKICPENYWTDKNDGYLTWRRFCIYDNMSLNYSYNEKFFKQSCRENQHIFYIVTFFLKENRVLYEILWKNTMHPDRLHTTIRYGTCTLHAG
jgi:hypothetical protein